MIVKRYKPLRVDIIARILVLPLLAVTVSLAGAQAVPAAPSSNPLPLTLPAAVDMALAHNRKLQLAHLSVSDSKEQKRIAQSHYYPSLTNGSRVLHITALEGVVIPAGAFGSGASSGTIPAQTIRIDQGASTSYTSGTGLDQPLTQLLRIHASVKAAEADVNVAELESQDSQNEISLQVHQLYFSYLIQEATGAAAADALKAATDAESENEKSIEAGRLLSSVELGSRADVLDRKRAVLTSKLTLDDLTLQLDDLLGLAIGTKLQLDLEMLDDPATLPSRDEAMRDSLQKSPAALAARQNVEKAKAGLAVARDAYIPNITATARYSYQSGLPFLVHNFGSFGAAFSYDLFDGGAREAKIREAKIKLQMAQTQLSQVEADVQVGISAAYDRCEELQELASVSDQTVGAREESYRVQLERARVDAALDSKVAAAQAATTSAKAEALSAKLSLYLAKSNVVKLLGQLPR